MKGTTIRLLIFMALLFCLHAECFSLGSGALSNQAGTSTKALGHGYCFAGVADDASAIYFNPAGLTQVKGTQMLTGGSILKLESEHTSLAGQKDSMANNTPFAPYFYLSHSDQNSKMAYGVGVNAPFGLITEWKDDSFSRYYATKSSVLMYVVNPTVAYSVTDRFSVGGGIDYFNVYDVELDARTPDSLVGGPSDGHSKITAKGHAWGYNFGLHLRANEKHSFGLSYRSQVDVPLSGETELTDLSGLLAAGFGGPSFKTRTTSEIKFPQSILLGYGFKANERWTVFADYEWDDWKIVEETRFHYEQPNALLTSKINRDWNSTNNIGVGTEFKATPTIDLRGGMLVYERVIPSGTVEASLPDSSRFAITVGSSIHARSARLDVGYDATFVRAQMINNNAGNSFATVDGKFKSIIHVVSIGLSKRWGNNRT